MNGVHDMGGLHGMGRIAPEPEGTVFHYPWEARVHALVVASPTRGNIDAGRHQRERIPGPEYLRMSYYERWYRALCDMLVEQGLVTEQELSAGRSELTAAKAVPRLQAASVEAALTRPLTYVREVAADPLFAIGQPVRVRNLHPSGHTRAPRYVRGRLGVVERHHGAHVLPDSNAHGRGEDPRHLYSIRFDARELWGPDAPAADSVWLDLWEPYLEPA